MRRRSEIWLINLDPTIGAEIKKTRAAVIVSSDEVGILPLKIIAPITDWKPNYAQVPWMVHVQPNSQNGLTKPSAVDTFQVRSVSETRFIRRMGVLNAGTMQSIESALAEVLEISQETG
jgi:mRNA interferase MazF